jgi:hypothetical protein
MLVKHMVDKDIHRFVISSYYIGCMQLCNRINLSNKSHPASPEATT